MKIKFHFVDQSRGIEDMELVNDMSNLSVYEAKTIVYFKTDIVEEMQVFELFDVILRDPH